MHIKNTFLETTLDLTSSALNDVSMPFHKLYNKTLWLM